MQSFAKCLGSLVGSLGPEGEKAVSVAQANAAYVKAVREVWKAETARRMILDHTNAFYIRRDDTPRKGPKKDEPYIVCEVCMDEPLLRTEMDARKEMVALQLMQQGLRFNEIRVIPARRGMRQRHPFAEPDRT